MFIIFLISKFSKTKQNFKLILEQLQRIFFDTKLFLQERKLILKLFYRRETVLIQNFNEIDRIKLKIMKN